MCQLVCREKSEGNYIVLINISLLENVNKSLSYHSDNMQALAMPFIYCNNILISHSVNIPPYKTGINHIFIQLIGSILHVISLTRALQ